jgi:hypothetical protein
MRIVFAIGLALAGAALAQGIPPSRVVEGAMLSDHVYNLPLKGKGTLLTGSQLGAMKAPPGYTVVGALGNDATGFQGAIYKSDATGHYTVAYRGTELTELKDVQTDAAIKFDGSAFQGQLKDAQRLTDQAVSTYGKHNVSITGHSLGGAIAQVESARVGLSAEAYNAPGMSEYIREKYPDARVELVTNHNRQSDPISTVGTQAGYVRTYKDVLDMPPEVLPPATPYGDPNAAVVFANVGGAHSMTSFSNYLSGGGTPIDPPTLRGLDGKSKVVDQWGDAGATARRMEFDAVAKTNASEAQAKAASAQAAATLSADSPAPDAMSTLVNGLLAIQAAKVAASADGGNAKAAGATCPKKAFSTPDGCHPGHDEKAHPGGCYCG